MTIYSIIIMIIGIKLLAFGIIMFTENTVSKIIFNVFPILSGSFLVFYSLMELGFVVQK